MNQRINLYLILIIITLSSCLPKHTELAEDKVLIYTRLPAFIRTLSSNCISIDMESFYDERYEASELTRELIANLQIYKNGQKLIVDLFDPFGEVSIMTNLVLVQILDDDGNIIGAYEDSFSVCHFDQNTNTTIQFYRLVLEDTRGNEHGFSWLTVLNHMPPKGEQ